ncbi:ABC transporter permease [Gallaecimonas xiamenensis]|uniref:Lipoprotein releasing system, transmembrane protein, LolC/E family protein n=1 Tax=Gallaecimonas xiamenensis 3-C-1 TaxID=745411 RepID=K2JKJ6_9GAMM|nr:ABC transporter permease [Gallaecimonas xiamenensis]EKE71064.1 lipoprotein releasing system, transmembrane protein, LolC/E family protein [Gallaecimonas xiamenensis 3-C-1]
MFRPASLFIATRYLLRGQRGGFANFVNLFALFGVTLGVMVLMVVLSVMNGFESQLKTRLLDRVPHLVLSQDQGFADWQQRAAQLGQSPEVKAAFPYVDGEVMLQSQNGLQGGWLQGWWPGTDLPDLARAPRAGQYELVLGAGLARKLDLLVGDVVRLYLPGRSLYTPLGRLPAQRQFTVVAVVDLASELNDVLAITHYSDLRRLYGQSPEEVNKLRVTLKDPFAVQTFERLAAKGEQLWDWRSRYGDFFAAVAQEKRTMSTLLVLIIAVAAFNILAALAMLVSDKRRDIAVLAGLGMTPKALKRIFVAQGIGTGLLGSALGLSLGFLLTEHLNLVLDVIGLGGVAWGYGPQGLPVVRDPVQMGVIGAFVILICALATLAPAHRASRIDPAVVLTERD